MPIAAEQMQAEFASDTGNVSLFSVQYTRLSH